MKSVTTTSTGLKSLDTILNNLQAGDNVVWQVDSIEDYRSFVGPFVKRVLEKGKRLSYMRFAGHPPLVPEGPGVDIYQLDAFSGFETFSKQVYQIITARGEEAYYVFDCLSDLLSAWATDLMVGNFFTITCPYLFELSTVAYFGLLRDRHSFKTIARIRETTQVLIDAYNCEENCYVHPLKVQNRYSPTMFFPHLQRGDTFTPITRSEDATRFIRHVQQRGWEKTMRHLDSWDRLFLKAEGLVEGNVYGPERQRMVEDLSRVIIGREKRLLKLAVDNLMLEDLIAVKERMIGTGYIGGKTAGMLIARRILQNDKGRDWVEIMEPHDSFYIGSDVFYTYIVENGWWRLLMEQQTPSGYFQVAKELQEKMLKGNFPDELREQFQQMIEYLGQSPIIVRSSSLLEDSFGSAFAGKYESHFCVNQGSPRDRYREFTEAVRRIYASVMNEDALAYRVQRGLQEMDEKMALLVQRVSGNQHRRFFLPDIGGVGFSYNAYVWKAGMKPEAGMLRLVLGLGTRAVNRVEGDYPRIVALDDPAAKPLAGIDDVRRFSQHDVDLLNTAENRMETVPVGELVAGTEDLPLGFMGVRDTSAEEKMREMGLDAREAWVITFDELMLNTAFARDMRDMMKRLQDGYRYPVDIEFTVNFNNDGDYRVNLLQCRPHQTRGMGKRVAIPDAVPEERMLFVSRGNFLGGSVSQPIARIIYVDPHGYSGLPQERKYEVARLVGRLNRLIDGREETPTMLIGPGRWGTTTPSLGVPTRFSEINHVAVLVELAIMSDNVLPELSFGTHFFQDLVETNIFYVALFPETPGVLFRPEFIGRHINILEQQLPESAAFRDVVHVCDVREAAPTLMADMVSQVVICFSKNGNNG
jgi:hypothetical protein